MNKSRYRNIRVGFGSIRGNKLTMISLRIDSAIQRVSITLRYLTKSRSVYASISHLEFILLNKGKAQELI